VAFNALVQQNKVVIAQRRISLVDLAAQHSGIREELAAALKRVFESNRFILGEDVGEFEHEMASYTGAGFAIACASGSDALFLALMALGIGPGDEVLAPPFTFFSTAGSVSRLGASPVFVDVDPATFTLDMNRVEDALRTHPRVRAIIPVHLYGGCADMDALASITRKRELFVIEDAAQAIGAESNHRRAGSIGHAGCLSFYPSKNLGALGDGGMVTTSDAALAGRLQALRVHGETGKYLHQWIGINSRLDTLQAAALRVKLRYLDRWTLRRQENAGRYRKALAGSGAPVEVPREAPFQTRHVYNQFVIRCPDRDALRNHLRDRGVGTDVYYPLSLHMQPCFAALGYKEGDFPASEKASREVLALPVHPDVTGEDIEYVCQAIQSFYQGR
jgi:dTDP-4-amino-4,6-dideoxygalactose transaminase